MCKSLDKNMEVWYQQIQQTWKIICILMIRPVLQDMRKTENY